MAVYGYTRVSTTEQAGDDRTSLDTQRRKSSAAAELSSLTVDEFVEEPGVSGSKPLADRPVGGPLLARLVKGDVLVVAKLGPGFPQCGRCPRDGRAAEGPQGGPDRGGHG
jgi:putative DNA-invertase from lambdoid prophage Rac